MEFLKSFLVLVFMCYNVNGVIYRLNESEYARMPPLFHMDKYDSCIGSGGKYCAVPLVIVPDTTSDLFNLIQNYSEHIRTHFNHTKLQYGICATKTCQKYTQGTEVDITKSLGECLNDSFWNEYKLQVNIISEDVHCHSKYDEMDVGAVDIIVAAVCFLLLVLNVVGSLYDFFLVDNSDEKGGNKFLLCFSIKKNWSRLVAPMGEGFEPRLTRFKGFFGLKAILMALVICCHSLMPLVISGDNTLFMEEAYHNPVYFVFVNGTAVVQTFFVITGILIAFHVQLHRETHQVTWKLVLKGLIHRWLKLTPSYAVMLAITATWMRFAGSGPLWQNAVVLEAQDCRKYWWQNLLYITNYVDSSRCMPQMWYLATDIQLHAIGIALCILTGIWRKAALISMLVLGLAALGLTTYWYDLDGAIILTPESCRNFFLTDPTFNLIYKRGHTNITCFVIGLMLGLAIYSWQKTDFKFQNIIKHRAIYYALCPLVLASISLGYVFYLDAPRQPMYLRVLYAVLNKPVYAGLIGTIIVGMVFKYEDVYRGILEWPVWAVPSRVSYAAYIVHVAVIRYSSGTRTTLTRGGAINIVEIFTSSVMITFFFAVIFWFMVDGPLDRVVRILTSGNTTNTNTNKGKTGEETNKVTKIENK